MKTSVEILNDSEENRTFYFYNSQSKSDMKKVWESLKSRKPAIEPRKLKNLELSLKRPLLVSSDLGKYSVFDFIKAYFTVNNIPYSNLNESNNSIIFVKNPTENQTGFIVDFCNIIEDYNEFRNGQREYFQKSIEDLISYTLNDNNRE